MISWGTIVYGGVLSAMVALVAAVVLAHERRPVTLALVAVSALAGPLAWNAVLHARHGAEFFVDAPVRVFPVSWQDTGSGVWTLALASVLQNSIQKNTKRALVLAMVAAAAAWLVDIFLY